MVFSKNKLHLFERFSVYNRTSHQCNSNIHGQNYPNPFYNSSERRMAEDTMYIIFVAGNV